MSRRRDWMETIRALGEAFADVARAELAVVSETVKAWGKSWLIALAIVAAMLSGLFWSLGLLTVAVVHGLMRWRDLELWQAALLTAGALLLLIVAAGGVVYFLARRFDSPVAATRRRLDDHLGWWNERVFLPDETRHLSEGESDETAEQRDAASPGAAAEPPPGG